MKTQGAAPRAGTPGNGLIGWQRADHVAKRPPAHPVRGAAIAAGMRRSARSVAARERHMLVARTLRRFGRGVLLAGPIRDAELASVLPAIAAGLDPATDEGRAVALVAEAPASFAKYCRPNSELLRADAQPVWP